MGLSRDDRMGDDLTTNCVVRSNGGVDIVTGEFQTCLQIFSPFAQCCNCKFSKHSVMTRVTVYNLQVTTQTIRAINRC